MKYISIKLVIRGNNAGKSGGAAHRGPLPSQAPALSYQRPEHREDAGGSHDEQPAQGLRIIVLHHLDHAQQGLYPWPPQVPQAETLQVHQAGPGAAAKMPPHSTSLGHLPGPPTPSSGTWEPTDRDGGSGSVRQRWEQKGQGPQGTLVDPATVGRPRNMEVLSVHTKAKHPNSSA